MSKRTLVTLTLITVFALSLIGAYTLGANTVLTAPDQSGQANLTDTPSNLILVSDEPICPPSVPPPCG